MPAPEHGRVQQDPRSSSDRHRGSNGPQVGQEEQHSGRQAVFHRDQDWRQRHPKGPARALGQD
eukprot:9057409-Lingulodinium_polyedra.AAC.1